MHLMRLFFYILFCGSCLLSTIASTAQRSGKNPKSQYTKRHHNFRSTVVRGKKAKLLCPVFENNSYPFHGLGFKLGDPFGLTYKYYAKKNFAVAVDLGKPSSGLYNRYFREKFSGYANEPDTLGDNASLTYSTHEVTADLTGEVKFLYSIDADRISEGLQMYIGAGWQWKSTRLRYHYFYNLTSPSGGDLVNAPGSFDRTRVTMGPQLILGIEYAYFELPVSAFMEIEFFTDIQTDPGWQRFEGGVGLRYIF